MVVGRLGGNGLPLVRLFGAPAGQAHALLEWASRVAGGLLAAAPTVLSLRVTEAAGPRLCRIELCSPSPGGSTVIPPVTSVAAHRSAARSNVTVRR